MEGNEYKERVYLLYLYFALQIKPYESRRLGVCISNFLSLTMLMGIHFVKFVLHLSIYSIC